MMTREEAIEIFEQKGWWIAQKETFTSKQVEEIIKLNDAVNFALSALRPVSREQVEKVLPGCDFCKIELDDYPYIVAHSDYSSSDTCYEPSFCPVCGKPLTDEAVQMVMEKLKKVIE